jgi:hypothetical protein
MPRPRKTDDDVRAANQSLRVMLTNVRRERDDAEAALEAVLNGLGECCDDKARKTARAAIEARRAKPAGSGVGGDAGPEAGQETGGQAQV